jgi:hypothetical protein
LADALHDIGHAAVIPTGHVPQDIQHLVVRIVPAGMPDEVLAVGGKVDPAAA